jgi:PIN domain nuclease of toxin-antitoxin system
MRILLDTHIFIWMATEPERLSLRFTESIIVGGASLLRESSK